MQQIFTEESLYPGQETIITGADARHLAQVVRIRAGEKVRLSEQKIPTEAGKSFLGEVVSADRDQVCILVTEEVPSTELPIRIELYQGIPKGDRMETVIEKAVELGACSIIPVEMKYCVVKLDEKKKKSRISRYQSIAESAAKQSKRSVIPVVEDVMSYSSALEAATKCDVCLLPYECKEGMAATGEALKKIRPGSSVAIIIGPEGGFASEEIRQAETTGRVDVISLGKRILRTDTAAITTMSMVMLEAERHLWDQDDERAQKEER